MIRYATAMLCALALGACEREVIVQNEQATTAQPPFVPGPAGVGGVAGSGGSGGLGGFMAPPMGGASGDAPLDAGGGVGGEPAPGGEPAAGSGSISPPVTGLLAGVDQAGAEPSTVLDRFEVLTDALRSIERPAVGDGGASLLQFQGASRALVLNVRWDHATERWYSSSGAYQAFSAAYLDQHFALLHAEAYGVYANGSDTELSGTPSTYKEFIAASASGVAWVDYPAGQQLGEIVLRQPDGTRLVLSDRRHYRASLALSAQHAVFVEYANTAPGSVGQVMVQPIAGGAPFPACSSAYHQDHPAVDGDWVVLEEYRSESDAVIRACNVLTGQARDVSAAAGFRSHADIQGTRVVWEDYRDGAGDIYWIDLASDAEQALISGSGHSVFPRVTADGLVWVESAETEVGLLRARWQAAPEP